MIAQGGGDAAHDAAVARREARVFLIDQAPRLKRLLSTIDQRQGAFRRVADASPVHFHPFHPAARQVRRVEAARREQRLSKQQGHGGVVVIRRVLGGWGKISHAGGKLFANGLGRTQILGRDSQLVAGDECQQRAPRTRHKLGLHWPAN